MTFKKAYYYLFYKLTKVFPDQPFMPSSEYRAGVVILVLEAWLLLSFPFYYAAFFGNKFHFKLNHPIAYILAGALALLNYMAFYRANRWERYAKEFKHWPERKNRIGGWLVFGVIVAVISNCIFSVYCLSQAK